MKSKKQRRQIAGLVVALIVVLIGGLLFMGAVSGWFSGPDVILDTEYYCNDNCPEDFLPLSKETYKELIDAKKSFVVFVDKDGCTTADKMRSFVLNYMKKRGIEIYRFWFDDMKETSMHNLVKYYPSMVIVSKGKVFKFLRADSDEDVGAFENESAFDDWLERYI